MSWIFGGGGSSSTSVEIPEWLEEAIKPLLSGSAEKYGDWQQILYDLGMGDANENGLPYVLEDHRRGTAGMDYWENEAGRLAGTLSEGEPLYGEANSILNQLSQLNDYERLTNRLATIYADPRNNPYEHKRATEIFNHLQSAAAEPVDFSGYESDPLFQQQMESQRTFVDPVIGNSATLMGLGRSGAAAAGIGLANTQAREGALENYIGQKNINKQTRLSGLQAAGSGMAGQADAIRQARAQELAVKQGLGRDLRTGRQAAAEGKVGIADRSHQKHLDAIDWLSKMGATRRGIHQDEADSAWEERMRKIAAFESALGGPLGMIPGMMGATTIQRKKS